MYVLFWANRVVPSNVFYIGCWLTSAVDAMVSRSNDSNESKVVAALKDQHVLIITLAAMTPSDAHSKIVQAAVKAEVPHIMPKIFGIDESNEALVKESPLSVLSQEMIAEIEAVGSS